MPKVKDETRYKRKMRENYPHWSESYEPAMGSGTGYPDIQLLSPRKVLLPIELKVGEVRGDRIFPREVRPDQVVWHHNFSRFGGIAVCAIGFEREYGSNKWDTYAILGQKVIDWREGYNLLDCFYVENTLGDGLVRLVEHFLLEDELQPLARAIGRVI